MGVETRRQMFDTASRKSQRRPQLRDHDGRVEGPANADRRRYLIPGKIDLAAMQEDATRIATHALPPVRRCSSRAFPYADAIVGDQFPIGDAPRDQRAPDEKAQATRAETVKPDGIRPRNLY